MKQFTGGMEKKTLLQTSAITLAAVIRGITCLIIFWTKSTEQGKLPIIAWQIYLLLFLISYFYRDIYIFDGLSDQYQGGQQQCLPQEVAPLRPQYCYQQLALHLIYLARHQL